MDKTKIPVKKVILNVVRAGLKAFVIYLAYFIFTMITKPYLDMIGKYSIVVGDFFLIILGFTVVAEILSGTFFCYVVRMARDLLVILYLIAFLNGGIIEAVIQEVRVVVNLQFFLLMIVLIHTLNFAKNMLNAVDFLNERAEKEILTPSLVRS